MPNKKQSARPAESGWLLEIGVLGVAKSLSWMEKTGLTLLEMEHLLRCWGVAGLSREHYRELVSKRMNVAPEPWKDSSSEWDGSTWDEFYSREESKLKRKLTRDEWEKVAIEHYELTNDLEGQWLAEEVSISIEEDGKLKKDKGSPVRGGKPRPSLERWRMDKRTALIIIATSGLDSDQQRKLRRIKASSRALGDLLEVLSGKLSALPKKYSPEEEKALGKNGRKQLAKIHRVSVYGPGRWFLKLAKARLSKSRKKVIRKKAEKIALKLRELNALRKKWGVRK